MQRELAVEVVAIDVSERMVELCRARGVDARVGDAQELPFGDAEFDLVVAAWVLFHLPDLDRGLAEIVRVLRPGGRLVAVTNSEHHLAEARSKAGFSMAGQMTFSRENGERALRRHFTEVERTDVDGCGDVPERGLDPRLSSVTRHGEGRSRERPGARGAAPRDDAQHDLRRGEVPRDPRPGADRAQAERRRARGGGDLRARARLHARRRSRLPDVRLVHGRLLPRAHRERNARADRRDDPFRRDPRPRRRARPARRRQAFDWRRGGQDLARGRADRRGVRRPVRQDVRARARTHGRHARQARVDSRASASSSRSTSSSRR